MRTLSPRRFTTPAVPLLIALVAGCAGTPRPGTYTRLVITGDQIREDGYATAYEALTHHREIILFEDRIAFQGGDDRSGLGRDRLDYYEPMLVLNGNYNLNDAITTLRQIRAAEIITIRLYYASMVPAEYRRPGAEGGVIEVTTR